MKKVYAEKMFESLGWLKEKKEKKEEVKNFFANIICLYKKTNRCNGIDLIAFFVDGTIGYLSKDKKGVEIGFTSFESELLNAMQQQLKELKEDE